MNSTLTNKTSSNKYEYYTVSLRVVNTVKLLVVAALFTLSKYNFLDTGGK
jgi:hypothetical protein